jgi:nitroimidazol reductase NimA-like FMN-containing flavoprotein (pyridoxamine 5'-phosphate oxidase superfamily)
MVGDVDVDLSDDECWELLRRNEFGRLAFRVAEEQHIAPINYAVDRQHGRNSVLFRTAAGTKLLAVALGAEVAFEIDEFGDEVATSVVVRGRPHLLEDDEARRAESLPLRPWVGTDKHDVVEIVPEVVSGRRFELSRPWLHLRVDD